MALVRQWPTHTRATPPTDETYPPESIHDTGYAHLCQKLYGVLFVYFQHLYGTFPNNLFNYLHMHMQANEVLRELLRVWAIGCLRSGGTQPCRYSINISPVDENTLAAILAERPA